MPRKTRRFGKLIKAYRANGGTAAADSQLGHFGNWLTGKTKIDVKRKPSADNMKRQRVKVIPFSVSTGATVDPTDYYATSMTGQARAIYEGLGTDKSVFGLTVVSTVADAAGATVDAEFYPALARVFVVPTGTAVIVTKKSAVTQGDYKTQNGRSGSIPFGRGIGTGVKDSKTGAAETVVSDVDQEDVAKSILTNCKKAYGGFVVKTISFVPEQLRPGLEVSLAPATPPNLAL
jgi:hypothetical protein